jgi:hypothetical protein
MIVVPEFDAYGLIEGIHVLVPEGASVSRSNIKGHAGTVELLWRYKGLAGRLRHVIDRAAATLGEAQGPADPRGKAFDSEAFYAAAEVKKLTGLVEQLRGEPALDEAARQRHEASIKELEDQIAYHTALLASAEQGPRYVAIVWKNLIPEVRTIQSALKERVNQPLDKTANALERHQVMYTYKNLLPNLRDNFEAIGDPRPQAYNCFAHTVGTTSRNQDPVVSHGDNPFAELDSLYNPQGYRLTQRADPVAPAMRLEKDKDGHSQPMVFSRGKKIVVYGTISNGKITKFTHAAIQESDGTWSSKMGLGPLIRHPTVAVLSGGAWGVPVAVYEK